MPDSAQEMMRTPVAPTNPFLHRFAWLLAAATLFLICSGGMVTSKGVGLAVPDWPTTFGYNMFFFPVSKWVGGIFFEHTHRLIASVIGFLSIILAVWLALSSVARWIKVLGWVSLGTVVFLVGCALAQKIKLSFGVVGHEGSTVLVVLNGLRLLRLRPDRST